jgi:hypothetical protein
MNDADKKLHIRRLLAKYWVKKIELGVLFSEINIKGDKLQSGIEVECAFDAVASLLHQLGELRDNLVKLEVSETEFQYPSILDR